MNNWERRPNLPIGFIHLMERRLIGTGAVDRSFQIASKLPRTTYWISELIWKHAPGFSNQTLVLEVSSNETGLPLLLGSFHVPNGSQHGIYKGDFKRRFGHGVAAWLSSRQTSTVFGIDANSPELDHIDESKVKLFRSDSENLFGSKRTHDLRDVYLDQCRAHAITPNAISFEGTRKTATRFDHIWATRDFQVMGVKYGQLKLGPKGRMLYSANGEVLSDHAWVAAQLRHPIV